jgi:hypothetical protein
MKTVVPPPGGPLLGLTPVTTGCPGTSKVNLSKPPIELVPPGAVTVTSTVVPAVPGGLGAKMTVSPPDGLLKHGPGTEGTHARSVVVPNATAVAPVKPLPRICTVVPPAAVPWPGSTASTTGTLGAR